LIRGVLFDFGGVLAEEGFLRGLGEIARRNGLDPEEFLRRGVDAVHESGYVTGTGTETAFWRMLCRRTGIPCDPPAYSAIVLECFVLRPRLLAEAQSLREQGYRVAILSDQTDWLDRLDRRDHFFRYFDRVFNSYHQGRTKKDPLTFDETVQSLGLKPGGVLFIDDKPPNIQRAISRGLHGILFTSEEKLLADLEALPRAGGT
jgi:putative hydrolase of the HAD superfamily